VITLQEAFVRQRAAHCPSDHVPTPRKLRWFSVKAKRQLWPKPAPECAIKPHSAHISKRALSGDRIASANPGGKLMMSQKTIMTVALFFATALTATAQNRSVSHPDDTNGDGRISRDEWRGDRRAFREYDQNRDGVLSGNEVPGNNRTDHNRKDGEARSKADRLDTNRSGVVEGSEWPYSRDVFRKLDRDGNSVLTRDELDTMNSATRNDLDRNRNGRVDRDEWSGGFADFQQLDNDRDGSVSSTEYYQRGGEWRRKQRFDALDTNRDGILQSTEWKGDVKEFHRLDTDHDSKVSLQEFRSDTERYLTPGR
jgi:Ca2+-binding EF-hand superfamily protein